MVAFNLTYFHRETGKAFKGAMLSRIEYKLINPETNEKFFISSYLLRKNYKADARKRKRVNKFNNHGDNKQNNLQKL